MAAFAETRGWGTATTRAVQHAIAVLAVTSTDGRYILSPQVLDELRRRHVPLTRVREFLTAHELTPEPTSPAPLPFSYP